jgi:predicted site-specific integrase-resolvase
MKTYSTAQIARISGVHKVTLQRWLISGKLKEPKKVNAGNIQFRIWFARDLKRVREYKDKNYRKGRGRKSKAK